MDVEMSPMRAMAFMRGAGGGSGDVIDVQVNGVSVVQDKVANVPVASYNVYGVVKADYTYGIAMLDGFAAVSGASAAEIKSASTTRRPIQPAVAHTATFYGLAKAAGDTTQKDSANAVGAYTENAKSSISQMLNAPETVSDSAVTITGKAGISYVCGEVATLTITPPASGVIDVRFESGSTPTVLTVPASVIWPAWFDPDDLEADTVYEITIEDGVYAGVMSWA